MNVLGWLSPPPSDDPAVYKWRMFVAITQASTMTGLAVALFVMFGQVPFLHPGFARADGAEISALIHNQEHLADKIDGQQIQIALAQKTGLEILLDGWRTQQCLALSMGNTQLANVLAGRIRDKQPEWRALNDGRDYAPLPCP